MDLDVDYSTGSSSKTDYASATRGNITLKIITNDYVSKWKIIKLIFTSALIVVTVAGNAATLYGVCKMKSFRHSVSNLYIASLAAADLIVGAFVMTFMMLYSVAFDNVWIFGAAFCDVWQTVDYVSCTVSLYSVCAIGFDRWLNLEKPLRMFKRSKVIARRVIICLWMLPVVLWTPVVISLRLTNGPPNDSLCNIHWRPTYSAPLVGAFIFYAPVLMLIALFARISVVIRNHLNFLRHHSNRSLLELDNRSGSPSLLLAPSPRLSGASKAGCSPNHTTTLPIKQMYKPTVLNLEKVPLPAIPADNSSKDRSSSITAQNKMTFLLPPYRDRSSTTPTSTAINFNNGNQSPLAIQMMKGHLSPSSTGVAENGSAMPFSTASSVSSSFFGQPSRMSFRRHSDSAKSKTHAVKRLPPEGVPLLTANNHCSKESVKTSNSKTNCTLRRERSASRDSVLGSPQDGPQTSKRVDSSASILSHFQQERKRPSVTSDTAVVYTKSVLSHKPPLLRAHTDAAIEIQHAQAERKRSARFSIISITGPLFNRRYSVNIFTDMLPCPNMTQQIRAAKAVGVLMLFFLICWLPYLILWPLKTYCDHCVSDTALNLSIWANYLNSTINPVLYTLCSPRFQRVFRENCRCRCHWARKKHSFSK